MMPSYLVGISGEVKVAQGQFNKNKVNYVQTKTSFATGRMEMTWSKLT